MSTVDDDEGTARVLSDLAIILIQTKEWKYAEEVILTIKNAPIKSKVLGELGTDLSQNMQGEQAIRVWQQAKAVIDSIDSDVEKIEALKNLGITLAKSQQWKYAKEVINAIDDEWKKEQALKDLKTQLSRIKRSENEQNKQKKNKILEVEKNVEIVIKTSDSSDIRLVQHQWKQANTRDEAFRLFSLVNGLVLLNPELSIEFSKAFIWVDSFLKE